MIELTELQGSLRTVYSLTEPSSPSGIVSTAQYIVHRVVDKVPNGWEVPPSTAAHLGVGFRGAVRQSAGRVLITCNCAIYGIHSLATQTRRDEFLDRLRTDLETLHDNIDKYQEALHGY